MSPIASCRVGKNPIINGRERVHIHYHVVIPDKPTRVGVVNVGREIKVANQQLNQLNNFVLAILNKGV